MSNGRCSITRRALLKGGAILLAADAVRSSALADVKEVRLRAAPVRALLRGKGHSPVDMWGYNDGVPGPVLRFRQGDTARIQFINDLPEPSTIHWHGLRVPIDMDGVPELSQPLVDPGGQYEYLFELPDAGTFWYHPHHDSREQLGRGLSGVVVVEEREPPTVDQDVIWQINDWRLTEDGALKADFANAMDALHDGRFGNLVTINGRQSVAQTVRAGERWRLRLVNAANARVLSLEFEGHTPWIIAFDGNPVPPHEAPKGQVRIAPGQRVDLILDMLGQPGEEYAVRDVSPSTRPYVLISLTYSTERPIRESPLDAPMELEVNPLPPLDLATAVQQDVILGGGTLGDHGTGTEVEAAAREASFWTINGVAARNHRLAPMIAVERGRTVLLRVKNDTLWPHPIHLHGFPFRVLTRNGESTPYQEWRDTELLLSNGSAEVAFTADRPGDWMFHCHILDHQETGMMSVIRVS